MLAVAAVEPAKRCSCCDASQVHDSDGQLVRYSTDRVVQLGAIVARYISAVSMNQLILSWGTAGILWILAQSPGTNWDVTEEAVDYVTAQAGVLTGLVTFMLGLFTSLTLSRWWTVRTAIAKLHGDLRNVAMIIASALGPDAADDTACQLKRDTIRLVQLVHRLLFVEARVHCALKAAQDDTFDCLLTELQTENLLSDEEASVLRQQGAERVACTVLLWLQQKVNTAVEIGLLKDSASMPLWYIASAILSAASSIDIVREHIEAQLPLPYVHIISFMTKVNMLVITTQSGVAVGYAFRHGMHFYGCTELAVMLMLPVGFQALLDLHRRLRNPLDHLSTSFPMRHMQLLLRAECDHLLVPDGHNH